MRLAVPAGDVREWAAVNTRAQDAMRILILQTTRMGDVIQTTPLIRAVRNRYPDAQITVMIRQMGKAIIERNPDVNDTILYDENAMFLDLRSRDSERLLRAFQSTEDYIEMLRGRGFDLAYNCSHSLASAMLLKLAGIPKVVGAHMSDDWHFVIRGGWVTYFFTSVFHREYNDLNLCDITRRFVVDAAAPTATGCAGTPRRLVFEVSDADRASVQTLLAEHRIGPDDFVACFQLGASEQNKQWPPHRFAELARRMHDQYHARIFLVGVASESVLGEAFQKAAPGLAAPLYGKTSVGQLGALLERAAVLVTNDTGTMHLAAAVGCPVALVSVGYVHYRETGPYGPGHCAVEWRETRVGAVSRDLDSQERRERIQAAHVLEAVRLAVDKGRTVPAENTAELAGVDILVTRFAPDGCLQWYPAVLRPITEMDVLRIAYRALWIDHLGATRGDPKRERSSLEELLRCYAAPEEDTVETWADRHSGDFAAFADLAQKGVRATERLIVMLEKGESMRKAQEIVAGLMELDDEMRLFSELHHAARPLVRIARYERDNLEGADPRHLAETTLRIYRDAFARARLMERKVRRLADVWKALALSGSIGSAADGRRE